MPRFTQSFLFVFALLLVSVEPSPAPVMEIETPTPTPVQDHAPKRKSAERTGEGTSNSKPAKETSARTSSFAGRWTGIVRNSYGTASEWTISVSTDERHVAVISSSTDGKTQVTENCPSYREGTVVRFTDNSIANSVITGSLQLDSSGKNLVLNEQVIATALFVKETATFTGVLTRQKNSG